MTDEKEQANEQAAEPVVELNDDGLEPGQPVPFELIKLAEKRAAEARAKGAEKTNDDVVVPPMTDGEIRDEIERLTGERPHHRKNRDTLLAELEAAR